MLFKINTFAVLPLLFRASIALPSDSILDPVQSTERDLSPIIERGLAYRCKSSDPQPQCNQDITTLQAREARGCDVWKCIAEGAAALGACTTAATQGGVDPLADLACFAAMTVYIEDCNHCLGTCKVAIFNSANWEVGSTCVDAGSSGSIKDTQTGKTVTFKTSPSCGITETGGLGSNESLDHSGAC
ncbi:hypothetical protein F5882DRAFT_459586 [Hyaloscypha sp. PMI_1271]|nr:hypothetical protein F5882DRAFT_459586 [Hyaloscypha sp. PMI_1271]